LTERIILRAMYNCYPEFTADIVEKHPGIDDYGDQANLNRDKKRGPG